MTTFKDRARAEAERRWDLWRNLHNSWDARAMQAAFVEGAEWAVEQEPTDAEVRAGAKAITPRLYWFYDEWDEDDTEDREPAMKMSRAVLRAAREAREA